MQYSNLTAGQKILLTIFTGQKWYAFTISKGVSIKQTRCKNKNLGNAGQIKSFRGPHLDRESYVVHVYIVGIPEKWVRKVRNKFFKCFFYLILEYRSEYADVAQQCRDLSVQLLNQCSNTEEVQVSISPTFYARLFRTKVFWAAFL